MFASMKKLYNIWQEEALTKVIIHEKLWKFVSVLTLSSSFVDYLQRIESSVFSTFINNSEEWKKKAISKDTMVQTR